MDIKPSMDIKPNRPIRVGTELRRSGPRGGFPKVAASDVPPPPADPLDHDGDGRKGGSLAGEKATAKRKPAKSPAS